MSQVQIPAETKIPGDFSPYVLVLVDKITWFLLLPVEGGISQSALVSLSNTTVIKRTHQIVICTRQMSNLHAFTAVSLRPNPLIHPLKLAFLSMLLTKAQLTWS